MSEAGSYVPASDPKIGMKLRPPGSHMVPGLGDPYDPTGRRHTLEMVSTAKRERRRTPGAQGLALAPAEGTSEPRDLFQLLW